MSPRKKPLRPVVRRSTRTKKASSANPSPPSPPSPVPASAPNPAITPSSVPNSRTPVPTPSPPPTPAPFPIPPTPTAPLLHFPPPIRSHLIAERILVVVDPAKRDPLLDRYLAIMTGHGHACDVLEVTPGNAHTARAAIRAHPPIRQGSVQGIQIFGKTIPSFRIEYNPTHPGASDLPFGSDFPFFDTPFEPAAPNRHPAWNVQSLTAALVAPIPAYLQNQWVSRLFRLDAAYLDNLEQTQPPQVNNMLIVNASAIDDMNVRDRYQVRYSGLASGQVVRFGFAHVDFQERRLMDYLVANLPNATFLSLADHGTPNKITNLPPSQNGFPTLPDLPDVVEFAACYVGCWMDDEDPILCVAEAALRRGALTAIAPQCALAWNNARGFVDPHPGTNPYDDDNNNPSPMLDIWPNSPSLGLAQVRSVQDALNLLKTSIHGNKAHIAFQVLCGCSLFGDGTIEFATRSYA